MPRLSSVWARVRSKLASDFRGLCCVGARLFKDTTRTSMTVFVREALCVYAGGAWALQGRSLSKGVRGAM